jgi:RNA polymerase sigma factor (sigma-70 family)
MADRFQTTRWSLVLEASGEGETALNALDHLCRSYRGSVLAYIKAMRYPPDDAEDLAQSFFAHLLEQRLMKRADPTRGRFRAYLQTSLRNFLISERERRLAQCRGGDAVQIGLNTLPLAADAFDEPEQAFNRAWARTVLTQALQRLAIEAEQAGRKDLFEHLRPFLIESPADLDYQQVADVLGMRRNTVAVAVHRLRSRLQEIVREVVADTASDATSIEDELRRLRASMTEGTGR